MRLSRLHLWALAASVAGGLAVLGLVMFGWQLRSVDEEALGTALLISLYCVAGFGCSMAYEGGRAPWLMRIGLISAGAAVVGWLGYLWLPGFRWEWDVLRVAVWPSVLAGQLTIAGVLLIPRRRSVWWRVLRTASFVMLAVLGLQIAAAVAFYPDTASMTSWEPVWQYEKRAFRAGAALTMLTGACLALSLLVLWLPDRSPVTQASRTLEQRREYWLVCPRCETGQRAVTGPYCCTACGLQARVELT